MPLSLDIQPFSNFLDMYGDVDSSSYYHLPHVPLSVFNRQRATTRVLLQSLTISFEGQSETITPETGYAPVRLCSITRELLRGEPVDLSNEGHEDCDKPSSWDVVFDIPVPGWLPTTSVYGDSSFDAAGTRYALYATATFTYVDDGSSSFFTNICAPFRSRVRSVDARRFTITLRRFVESSTGSSSSAFPMSLYIVDAQREPDTEGSTQSSIPPDVLKKVHVVASIPDAVAMNETSLPLVLRLKGKDLDNSERKRLRVTEFSVDVEQMEVNTSSRDHLHRYPIPSRRHQPPHVALRNPHPIHTLCDTGLLMISEPLKSSVNRTFSLLPPSESGRYLISGDGRVFMQGSSTTSDENWYILETKVPIAKEPHLDDWAGAQKRRITESSPLFSVRHFVHVSIRCEYDLTDSDETVHERLHFSLPLKHVYVPEVTTSSEDAAERQQSVDLQRSNPYAQALPAYSQLFHSNGERKSTIRSTACLRAFIVLAVVIISA
ncbi:hypothetical protein BU15DRAFT_58476 [Melanogaster broomeanus]|nr:hypothetical protein BU15DRAFT_58476 [Melanogaster broomeanus]